MFCESDYSPLSKNWDNCVPENWYLSWFACVWLFSSCQQEIRPTGPLGQGQVVRQMNTAPTVWHTPPSRMPWSRSYSLAACQPAWCHHVRSKVADFEGHTHRPSHLSHERLCDTMSTTTWAQVAKFGLELGNPLSPPSRRIPHSPASLGSLGSLCPWWGDWWTH